jgi:3-oxoacyl-[acyl-carrier protein] reductase
MFSLEGAAIVVGGLLSGPHYVASKGAVGALVRWFARLGAPRNVLANGVAPGPAPAPMIAGREVTLANIPMGRIAQTRGIWQARSPSYALRRQATSAAQCWT